MLTFVFMFFIGVITGVSLVAAGVWYILSFFFHDPEMRDKAEVNLGKSQSSTFQLPPVLLSKINDESSKSKESCWALNFILYFLFRELRNSEPIRRWILRKLSVEFDELLASSVLGKFFSSISIQNVDVGQNFPVINWLKTSKIELHPVFKSISTLDILVDLDYSGGFQFAIEAETHLKHSAFLAVQFNEVKGQARLQFTTEPYAHWSFSFAENPNIDISVVSQLYGKSFNQVTSIIASQLKRSVRKKHTLPMFKIRYKPFFTRVEQILASLVPEEAQRADSCGSLSLTLIECRGLMPALLHGNLYAHVAVGDFNWVASYVEHPHVCVIMDVVCIKSVKKEVNLDFNLILQNSIPVVESVAGNRMVTSKAGIKMLEIEVGDEILAVDSKHVTSIKQCLKYFRNSTAMKVVWRIRRRHLLSEPKDNGVASDGLTRESAKIIANQETEEIENISASRRSSDEVTESDVSASEKRSSFSFRSTKTGGMENVYHVYRSADHPPTKDPTFMEPFSLNVDEASRYVNVTLWSSCESKAAGGSNSSSPTSSPSKKSKARDNEEFGKDRVIGILTIPIADIITESATTGMGYFVKDFYLGSPDGSASAAKEHILKDYSGFEPHMCYGKISLSFMYKSSESHSSKRHDSLDSLSSNFGVLPVETASEVTAEQAKISPAEERSQAHQFNRTHFRSATVCGYCNKKIWLKEAYMCVVCGMKCHKKCHERCVANTVCRGSTYQHSVVTPEIITTDIDPSGQDGSGRDDEDSQDKIPDRNSAGSNNIRRRTLGGFIVNAVQNRSVQLRRTGSATNLLPPTLSPNSASRSLPQSPQMSPTTSRKASVASSSSCNVSNSNPFETLDAGGLGISEDDLNAAVEHLIQHSHDDDLVGIAKETGRDVFKDLSLTDRKHKLNLVLNRLQEEIDVVSNERLALSKEEATASPSARPSISYEAVKREERVQALALLMLHFCAGLQHVQDLEEQEKEAQQQQQQISKSQIKKCDAEEEYSGNL